MFYCAASLFSKYTCSMGIIHHHNRIEILCQFHNLRKWCKIPIHAEHAISYNQTVLVLSRLFQQTSQMLHISMCIHLHISIRKSAPINNTCVIERIAKYYITFFHKTCETCNICQIASTEHKTSFSTLEICKSLLKRNI